VKLIFVFFQVDYLEIYCERIRDLLDEYSTKTNLQVREDPQKGIYVSGITEKYATSADELLGIMGDGKISYVFFSNSNFEIMWEFL